VTVSVDQGTELGKALDILQYSEGDFRLAVKSEKVYPDEGIYETSVTLTDNLNFATSYPLEVEFVCEKTEANSAIID